MTNRIVTMLPIWGFSALAVGSIGASIADSGRADPRPTTLSLLGPGTDVHLTSEPNGQRPLPRQLAIAPGNLALHLLRPSATAVARANATVGRTGRGAIASRMSIDVVKAISATASSTPSLAITVDNLAIPTKLTSPPSSLGLKAVQVSSDPQIERFATSVVTTIAGSRPLAKIQARQVDVPLRSTQNQAIFGTSARNAYKVYHPQMEKPIFGKSSQNLEAPGAPDQDVRTLTKKGTYLFFEDPVNVQSNDESGAILTAKDTVDAKAQIRVIAESGNTLEKDELTAPALQKKPLDFGNCSYKISPLGVSSTAPSSGEITAGQPQ